MVHNWLRNFENRRSDWSERNSSRPIIKGTVSPIALHNSVKMSVLFYMVSCAGQTVQGSLLVMRTGPVTMCIVCQIMILYIIAAIRTTHFFTVCHYFIISHVLHTRSYIICMIRELKFCSLTLKMA